MTRTLSMLSLTCVAAFSIATPALHAQKPVVIPVPVIHETETGDHNHMSCTSCDDACCRPHWFWSHWGFPAYNLTQRLKRWPSYNFQNPICPPSGHHSQGGYFEPQWQPFETPQDSPYDYETLELPRPTNKPK